VCENISDVCHFVYKREKKSSDNIIMYFVEREFVLRIVETPLLKRNIFIDIDNEKIIGRFKNIKALENNL
jgi:hypothetical protein